MRRYVTHAFALLMFALVASVALHGIGYVELDRLRAVTEPAPSSVRSSQLQFIEMEPLADATEATEPPREPPRNPRESSNEAADTTAPVLSQANQPPAIPLPEPSRTPPPEPESTPQPAVPNISNQQVVEQESDDPDVEPPPDARYLAAQNRRVEEETQATETSVRSDSARAEPPPPDQTLTEPPEPENDGRARLDETHPEREVADQASEGGEVGETRPPAPARPAQPSTSPTPPGGCLLYT
ncbi:MAG: hypothetical protein QUU85_00330, partial [Candidatus Eisenbacteria bacterium]|nr:hypothetical protein [Candidatus Eisenbacteria bacterium]